MFILYGHQSKSLGNETVTVTCPHCQQGPQRLWGFAQYFHVFYLPIFVFRKHFVLECPACQKTAVEKDWQDSTRNSLLEKRSQFKIPLYLFSGLMLFTLVLSKVGYDHLTTSRLQANYLASPHVGDVLVLRQGQEGKSQVGFWPALVEKVTDDAVIVRPSNYAYPNERGVNKNLDSDLKDKRDFFGEDVYAYPRTQLTSDFVNRIVRP